MKIKHNIIFIMKLSDKQHLNYSIQNNMFRFHTIVSSVGNYLLASHNFYTALIINNYKL